MNDKLKAPDPSRRSEDDRPRLVRLGGRVFDAGEVDVAAQLRNLASLIDEGRVLGTITSLDYGVGSVKLILDVKAHP